MSDDFVQYELNPISVQRKLVDWLSLCPKSVMLVHADEQRTDEALHFYAYDEESYNEQQHVAPDVSDAMSQATRRLGRAYTFETLADSLHIVVRQPTPAQSRQLYQAFSHHKSVLLERTWNIYFCVFALFASFIWFCCSVSKLHRHWHAYETPWETMFESAFALFIYFGDRVISTATDFAVAAAPAAVVATA